MKRVRKLLEKHICRYFFFSLSSRKCLCPNVSLAHSSVVEDALKCGASAEEELGGCSLMGFLGGLLPLKVHFKISLN